MGHNYSHEGGFIRWDGPVTRDGTHTGRRPPWAGAVKVLLGRGEGVAVRESDRRGLRL